MSYFSGCKLFDDYTLAHDAFLGDTHAIANNKCVFPNLYFWLLSVFVGGDKYQSVEIIVVSCLQHLPRITVNYSEFTVNYSEFTVNYSEFTVNYSELAV